jgi:hypothetical protein
LSGQNVFYVNFALSGTSNSTVTIPIANIAAQGDHGVKKGDLLVGNDGYLGLCYSVSGSDVIVARIGTTLQGKGVALAKTSITNTTTTIGSASISTTEAGVKIGDLILGTNGRFA